MVRRVGSRISDDPVFASSIRTSPRSNSVLLLREWYMHPNGQMPAYEFAFSDVNPPVHAWASWRSYKLTAPRGSRDASFLERTFQKLLLNFTWWVNRKDVGGRHVFCGGFLGLDNIGVFDRSKPLPGGGQLGTGRRHRVDGILLHHHARDGVRAGAEVNPAYEDIASKFFEHFVAIADAMNTLRRHRTVERGRRILLRPDSHQRASISRSRFARWWESCRCSQSRRSRKKTSGACQASSSG